MVSLEPHISTVGWELMHLSFSSYSNVNSLFLLWIYNHTKMYHPWVYRRIHRKLLFVLLLRICVFNVIVIINQYCSFHGLSSDVYSALFYHFVSVVCQGGFLFVF